MITYDMLTSMGHQEVAVPTPTSDDVVVALQPLVDAVVAHDASRAATVVKDIVRNGPAVFPRDWLELTAEALERGSFEGLSKQFREATFVGPDGYMLLIGPYTQRREGQDVTTLSALLGRVIEHEIVQNVAKTTEEIQRAPLRQPVQPIVPIRCLASTGNIGGEAGEAFIVPDGWGWRDSAYGPAINNMGEQLRRFEVAGRRCIERIFDADTAALLLAPMDATKGGERVRHRSYDLHDVGHVAGYGFVQKVNEGLIPGHWYRGVEEWRADGIAFEVGARLLDETSAGHDLASNFCVRFGMDVHRSSVDSDSDVACTLLMLDRLLAQGALKISGGRLVLKDCSYRGLVRAFEVERHDTIELTRRELELEHPTGIMRLYGTVEVHRSTRAILEGLVREPCRKFFTSLR
jgi:hypothetical protein